MKLPYRLTLAFLISGFVSVTVGAFLSALPEPFNRIDVGLVSACALVAVFRPAEALAAALGSGLFMDALSASIPGTNLLAGPFAVFLADLIFRRFLSNLSWLSFAVLNAMTFTVRGMILGMIGAIAIKLAGFSPSISAIEWGIGLILASLVQASASVLLLGLFRRLSSLFMKHYLYSRHAR